VISVFDLFKIGVGPSSSHTVGPIKAANAFCRALEESGRLASTARVETALYGSLAWTGRGHATDKAVVLGLSGQTPEEVEPDAADALFARAQQEKSLVLAGKREIAFDPARDIVFDTKTKPPFHPNTVAFTAEDRQGGNLLQQRWCSVGGGFIVREGEAHASGAEVGECPFTFANAAQLLQLGNASGLTIAEMIGANERARRPEADVYNHLHRVRETMLACVDRGLIKSGELPGGLKVKRRAPAIFSQLESERASNARAAHDIMDYISVFAIAVNEENAAGGRVVTAPTNGAAGVIPAVLRYYRDFVQGATVEGMDVFLLTAAAIGALFKMNASISGAEMGCQGEVGVACSMAAGGLAAALGGSNEQIENAAEIGMEHNLGLTCDPIGGLVQIPCIERNAFGAVKAINAASLALRGDGSHRVSLDSVVATMRETGRDMNHKYKETSLGGLAVNWVEC
jgi:L-serine dehydratase